MRRFVGALALAVIPVALAAAPPQQQEPDRSWAFPAPDKGLAPEKADSNPRRAPGSKKTYTVAQIADLNNPPDWFPEENGPKPQIILHGAGGQVCGCGACHLMSGNGHPQSANLAGQPVEYIVRQLADFKSGARNDQGRMALLGKELSEEQARQAAEWFSALKPAAWVKVVEGDTIPKTFVNIERMRLPSPAGGTEPIGVRIIEVPQEPERALLRDPHSGFVAYVPAGSVEKGAALVKTGGAGKTMPCATCHGPALKGMDEIPRIAGLSPTYIARQIFQFQKGARGGTSAALMKAVVANLTDEDVVAIAAYVASRTP